MAQVNVGGVDVMNALAFGVQHPSILNFIQTNMNLGMSNMLESARTSFTNTVQNLYEKVSGSEAVRRAEAIRRGMSSMFKENEVSFLSDIGSFQWAKPVMQRWIMAEPETRKLYNQQLIDGFSDTYMDLEPGLVGKDNYDWRRVMNGIVTFDEETDGWSATTYMEDLREGDRELTMHEKTDILDGWEALSGWYKTYNEDPTSKWNGTMG